MSIFKVIYLEALFFQISYPLVPKIGIGLKCFFDKSSQKQPLCFAGNHFPQNKNGLKTEWKDKRSDTNCKMYFEVQVYIINDVDLGLFHTPLIFGIKREFIWACRARYPLGR